MALKKDSGKKHYERGTGGSIAGRPGLGQFGVYVGSSDGCLYYLNAKDGIPIWASPYCTDVPIRGEVLVQGDHVIFAVATNKIYSISASEGTFNWEYHRERPSAMSAEGVASPVVAGNKVIAGFSDGYVVAVGLTSGDEIWATDLGQDVSGAVDISASPVVAGEFVYTSAFASGPSCLKLDDRTLVWTISYFGDIKVDL